MTFGQLGLDGIKSTCMLSWFHTTMYSFSLKEYTKTFLSFLKISDLLLFSNFSFSCLLQNEPVQGSEKTNARCISGSGNVGRSLLGTINFGCQSSQPTSSADGVKEVHISEDSQPSWTGESKQLDCVH
jgi:hypothetical protein